jgi:tRNA A-37 threonylcarbamoyl transferase component Bud32
LTELYERVKTVINKFHGMDFIHVDLHNDNIVCNDDLTDIRLIDFENSTYNSCVDADYLEWYCERFDVEVHSIEDIQKHQLINFII